MEFKPEEKLFRAVLPKDMIVKEDGSLSSSIFKQSTGVSVDRQADRVVFECIAFMKNHMLDKYLELGGGIVSVTCENCNSLELDVVYNPLPENLYHSEILSRTPTPLKISASKARKLSKLCIIEDKIEEKKTSFTF